ncbi:MAG: two pore domain potassium channel family protein [Chlamydiae bacterium]|nr:two pore domain potassium channel family protein [Chlamydiota bacterium]
MLIQFMRSRKYFLARRYNLLLGLLLLLFVFRPSDQGMLYFGVWKIFLIITIFAAIFNCKHNKTVRHIELALAVPIIVLSWVDFFTKSPAVFICGTSLSALFTLLCTGSIIHDMVARAQITAETLKGAICAYFLLAFSFAYIYWIIAYLEPGSFVYSDGTLSPLYYSQYISEMTYFSFVTLLAIGYGDIVATSHMGQTAAILEGVIGQFYVAILVARLVAAYAFKKREKV